MAREDIQVNRGVGPAVSFRLNNVFGNQGITKKQPLYAASLRSGDISPTTPMAEYELRDYDNYRFADTYSIDSFADYSDRYLGASHGTFLDDRVGRYGFDSVPDDHYVVTDNKLVLKTEVGDLGMIGGSGKDNGGVKYLTNRDISGVSYNDVFLSDLEEDIRNSKFMTPQAVSYWDVSRSYIPKEKFSVDERSDQGFEMDHDGDTHEFSAGGDGGMGRDRLLYSSADYLNAYQDDDIYDTIEEDDDIYDTIEEDDDIYDTILDGAHNAVDNYVRFVEGDMLNATPITRRTPPPPLSPPSGHRDAKYFRGEQQYKAPPPPPPLPPPSGHRDAKYFRGEQQYKAPPPPLPLSPPSGHRDAKYFRGGQQHKAPPPPLPLPPPSGHRDAKYFRGGQQHKAPQPTSGHKSGVLDINLDDLDSMVNDLGRVSMRLMDMGGDRGYNRKDIPKGDMEQTTLTPTPLEVLEEERLGSIEDLSAGARYLLAVENSAKSSNNKVIRRRNEVRQEINSLSDGRDKVFNLAIKPVNTPSKKSDGKNTQVGRH